MMAPEHTQHFPSQKMPPLYGTALVLGTLSVLCSYLCIIFIEIETVLWSGPIIVVCGLIVLGFAIKHRHRLGIIDGLSLVLVVITLTGVTWVLNWSPDDALIPFLSVGGVFLLCQKAAVAYTFTHPPMTRMEWQCRICGYPIYGLATNRCPECGGRIDPVLLEKYRQAPE